LPSTKKGGYMKRILIVLELSLMAVACGQAPDCDDCISVYLSCKPEYLSTYGGACGIVNEETVATCKEENGQYYRIRKIDPREPDKF
jgi:hypothetical protein